MGIRLLTVAAAALFSSACGSAPPDSRATWNCPAGWVETEHGGCGPAVLLCAADGGAADGACAAASDGGVTTEGLTLADNGSIVGPWHEPGSPSGPPSSDYEPLAATDCPADWQRAADGTCDPVLRDDCEANSGPLPGGSCTHTGASSCPAGAYPDVSAEAGSARVMHVLAGASAAGADGTEAHPFPALGEAVTAAGDGGWILLGDGVYVAELSISSHVHVVGRCAASVRVRATQSVFHVSGSSASLDLRDVTVSDGFGVVVVDRGAHASIRRVTVRSANGAGIVVLGSGTHVDVDDVFVVDAHYSSDGRFGEGIRAETGSTLTVQHTCLLHAPASIVAAAHATLSVSDTAILDGVDPPAARSACGIVAAADRSTIDRVVIRNIGGDGICAFPGDHTVRDVVVTGCRERSDGSGRGISATEGSQLGVERALLDGNSLAGLIAMGSGTFVAASDVDARNTRVGATLTGPGAMVQQDAVLSLTRARLASNHAGIVATGAATMVTMSDAVVSNTLGNNDGQFAFAIGTQDHATFSVERVLVDTFEGYGAVATGGSHIAVTDSVIAHGTGNSHGAFGVGVLAYAEGDITLSRSIVRDVRTGGASAALGGTLTLDDSLIESVSPHSDGGHGDCASAQDAASLTMHRVLAQHCAQSGVRVDDDAHATIEDMILRDVVPSGWGFGVGFELTANADVHGSRVAIVDVRAAAIATFAPIDPAATAGNFDGTDVYVRGVLPGTLDVAVTDRMLHPFGDTAAYGILAVPGGVVTLSRAALMELQYGFYDSDGVVAIHEGVIAGASVTAGAIASTAAMYTLDRTAFTANESNEVRVIRNLPPRASIPQPATSCTNAARL